MNQYLERLERKRLLEVAHEYEKKGYRVIVRPSQHDVPGFLSAFQLDMVAYGRDENVVLEVKSRVTLSQSPDLIALADAVNGIPGWRLELAVTYPPKTAFIDGPADDLNPQEIEARLAAADEALAAAHEEVALLLAGAAAEAALRLFAEHEEVGLEAIDPKSIVRQLFILGIISRADYDLLRGVLKTRDYIAHGFRVSKPEREGIVKLIDKTREFLKIADEQHQHKTQEQTFRAVN